MRVPVFRKIMEWKDYGLGYVIFDEEAEIIASNVVTLKKGETTAPSTHDNEEEVYIVMSGKGRVKVGEMEQEVETGTVIYVPRNAVHQSTGISDEDFIFVCVAIYFDRTPDEQ